MPFGTAIAKWGHETWGVPPWSIKMTDNKDTNTRLTILNTFTGETIADGLNAEESVKIFLKLADINT